MPPPEILTPELNSPYGHCYRGNMAWGILDKRKAWIRHVVGIKSTSGRPYCFQLSSGCVQLCPESFRCLFTSSCSLQDPGSCTLVLGYPYCELAACSSPLTSLATAKTTRPAPRHLCNSPKFCQDQPDLLCCDAGSMQEGLCVSLPASLLPQGWEGKVERAQMSLCTASYLSLGSPWHRGETQLAQAAAQ